MGVAIGLTGNIACGKSLVVSILRELGAEVLDADKLAHAMMAKDTDLWKNIVEEFGTGILAESGEIDRPKLGAIVFNDPKALQKLEDISYPAIVERTIELIRASTAPAFVVEAIKLIEAGLVLYCDSVWVITCKPEQQLERLMRDRHMSREEALTRMNAQPPAEEKLAHATVVIDNSGSMEHTREQVQMAWRKTVLKAADGRLKRE